MRQVLYEIKRADGSTKLIVHQTENDVRLTIKDKKGNRKTTVLSFEQWNNMVGGAALAQ